MAADQHEFSDEEEQQLMQDMLRQDAIREAWDQWLYEHPEAVQAAIAAAFKEAALEWLERHRAVIIEQVTQLLARRI